MHVVVLGRFPPPLDGQAIATLRVADLLAERHEVIRINTEPPSTTHLAAEVKIRPERVRHYWRLRKEIEQVLRRFPRAPVLWTSISPVPLGHWRDLLAVVPSFQPHQPIYGVVHRATFHKAFESPLTALTAKALMNRLDGLVFLGESISARCAPWISRTKRFVIPNTIDAALMCTDAEAAGRRRRPDEPLRLLFLSNMMKEKGYMDVLGAVHLLRTRGVPIRADFVGRWVSDTDRTSFKQFVATHQLGEIVTHHGGISDRKRIKAMYLAADALVLPSYHPTEAQPLVILEALNAGTPVVTTEHAGHATMVHDGNEGWLVPPKDPDALARAVVQLVEPSVWQRLSTEARRCFRENFSPKTVQERWDSLIQCARD